MIQNQDFHKQQVKKTAPHNPLNKQYKFNQYQSKNKTQFKKITHPPPVIKKVAVDKDISDQCPYKTMTEICQQRRWMPKIPLPEQQKLSSFKVMSYNILAQSNLKYVEYKNTAPQSLKIQNRNQMLNQEIQYINPDIICFQQIEKTSQLFKSLNKVYDFSFAIKSGHKVDGQATFWRKDLFEHLFSTHIQFQMEGENTLYNKPQICQISTIRLKSNPKMCLIVSNIHCLFNNNRGQMKLAQIVLSVKAIELLRAQQQAQGYNCSILFCGDFNMAPNSGTYAYLTEGQFSGKSCHRKYISGQNNGFFRDGKDLDQFFYNRTTRKYNSKRRLLDSELSKVPQYYTQILNTDVKYTIEKGYFEPQSITPLQIALQSAKYQEEEQFLFHSPWKLKSAYSSYIQKYSEGFQDKNKIIEQLGPQIYGFAFGNDIVTDSSIDKFLNDNTKEPAYTHFSPSISLTTDYVFYDDKYLQLRSVLEVLNSSFLQENFVGVPNQLIPSDHFSIVAEFSFKE